MVRARRKTNSEAGDVLACPENVKEACTHSRSEEYLERTEKRQC